MSRPWARCELVLALGGLVVFGWQLGAPSPWWDEAVTRHVVGLSWSSFFDLIRHVDLVHCAYYLLIRVLLAGTGSNLSSDTLIDAVRAVSVLCAGLTAGALAGTGRRLLSAKAGWLAGLVYLASPLASRYAQEARAYALVTLIVTLATLVLVRGLDSPAGRRQWAGYALLLGLAGLVNEVSLLIWLPHALLILTRAGRPAKLAWARSSALALVAISPFVVLSARQSEQVAWLTAPDFGQFRLFVNLQWESTWLPATILLAAVAGRQLWRAHPAVWPVGVVRLARWARFDRPAPEWTTTMLLGLAWALLPVLTLWIIAQRHPIFVPRYLVFTIPGGALALGAAISLLRMPVALIPAIALAASGWHAQGVYRDAEMGHSQGLRTVARCVADDARPGDGVIFLPGSRRIAAYAYPEDFAGTDDVAAVPADGADILYGRETTQVDRFDDALLRHDRVWLVTGEARLGDEVSALDEAKLQVLAQHYTMTSTCRSERFTTMLYLRTRKASGIQARSIARSGAGEGTRTLTPEGTGT